MSDNKNESPFLMGRMFGKTWIIISVVIIVVTGIGILFFDQSNDAAYNPLDPRPPAYKDTTEKGPVRFLNDDRRDTINDEN